jgi:curved DNA-binding protein CbpA
MVAKKLADIEHGADHFALLEVPQTANASDVKVAYFRLAKTFHPDRLAIVKLEDLRATVETCFAKIGEAFAVLSDDTRRGEYKKILAAGGEAAVKRRQEEEEALARRLIDAEEHFRLGEMALRRGNHVQAQDEFRLALEMNPDEAEHHALYAWATFMGAPDKERALHGVKQLFARALEVNKDCAPAYYYLGHVYLFQQDFARAMGQFHRAVELRPGWVEAERELRVLEMRRQKGQLATQKPGASLNPFKKK